MKLSDLPRNLVMALGPWPDEERQSRAEACARYRAKNLEACRARVRASKAKRKQAA